MPTHPKIITFTPLLICFGTCKKVRITYEIKPGIFDEKRGNAALLIKNSGFYFIFNPKTLDFALQSARKIKGFRKIVKVLGGSSCGFAAPASPNVGFYW